VKFIPLSALNGDNVVTPSPLTPWYEGPTLLGHLETVHIASDWNLNGFRLPVQWVNRPNNPTNPELHDFSRAQRANRRRHREGRTNGHGPAERLEDDCERNLDLRWRAGRRILSAKPITLRLQDDIDVSRGDMIVGLENLPGMSADLHARICWMHPKALRAGRKFF